MCTLALYFRFFDDYPVIVAANRDEQYNRASSAPGFLDENPKIIAGKDLRAGGTWLGVNEHGLIVGILNRRSNGQEIPATTMRSRGLLCMDLLRQISTASAKSFIDGHTESYNPFTVVFGDKDKMYASYNSDGRIMTHNLEAGLHVFSSAADFDLHSVKAKRAYSLFTHLDGRAQPARGEVSQSITALQSVLSDHSAGANSTDPGDAICVHREASSTVSSSIIFFSRSESLFETYYCPGAPCRNSFGNALRLSVR